MNLLGLDTSTEWLSLAIEHRGDAYHYQQKAGPKASELILPQIDALLTKANMQLAELDGVVFGAGPGAFTGVRIACGVAQGLALGAGKPVVGINVLEAMAEDSGVDKVIVAVDARMGEVYHAAYQRVKHQWHAVLPAGVYKPDDLPAVEGADWVGVGNAWAIHDVSLNRQYCQNLINVIAEVTPKAEAMIRLAKPIFLAGEAKHARDARPVYIRNRVALTTKEREQGLRL